MALGGGGARGFAHVLILEALDELGLKPTVIAGCSIGAIIGAGYAAGMTGGDIRAFSTELVRNRSEVFARLWRLRPRRVRDLFSQGGLTIGQFNAERVVENFVPAGLPRDFAGLGLPLKVIATDFYRGEEVVLTHGSLIRAMAASVAIPVLFRPVVIDGIVMFDGGVANPLPFDHVVDGTDIVIAVDVIGGPVRDHPKLPSSTEAIFGAATLLMRAITREKLRTSRPPDILVRPAINAFRVLDFMKASVILKAAEPVKDEVKRALDHVFAG